MNNKDIAIIALLVSISGVLCTTLGHYFEIWVISYLVAIILGIITMLILSVPE